ncbi:hypothetical protein ACO0K0_15245 [Undibacterium sp. SXout11W]|uniref:hypothetical protein n=1 Tax=Undibacterium sp. SXout11W TaxID=3413050 RepID=UPI003BEFED46
MKVSFLGACSLIICTSLTAHAAAIDIPTQVSAADKFIDALKHQRFKEATAMFTLSQMQDTLAAERMLKKIDEGLGGFSTMQPISNLPDGESIKLEVPALKTVAPKGQKFRRLRYTSTAGDGDPIFYELNISSDDTPPTVMSFGVHFPTADAHLTARAIYLVKLISP